MAAEESGSKDLTVKAKVVLQQCLSAKLMVKPDVGDQPAEYVEIKRGLVVYVCFLKGATPELVEKMVKSILGARLGSSEDGRLVSIVDLSGDILVVPQATLGGRPKGRMMQYQPNIDKAAGLELYTEFVRGCESSVHGHEQCAEAGATVHWGTYGNRQVLNLETNGPSTHIMEF